MANLETKKLSTAIKVKILSRGLHFDSSALKVVNETVKEEHRGYDDSNWGIDGNIAIPSELMLPGEIVVCTHVRPDTNLSIRAKKGKLFIFEGQKILSTISYLSRPKIWEMRTSTNLNMKRIANFYGRDCLNFNIYSGCEFWDVGFPCKFCSVKPTQERYGEVEKKKDSQQIAEVVKAAFALNKPKINFILVTGGSYLNGDKEAKKMIEVLRAIQPLTPWKGKIRGNASLMPPKNFDLIDKLMSTGIEHPSFNLEVWGKNKFKDICPGKEKYRGWDNIIECYKYGVKKFGRGVFWCNFVAGINKLEKLEEGFAKMAELGVVPGANVFHPDIGAILGKEIKSPPEEYIIKIYRFAAKLYHKYKYLPFFNEKVLRNSLANEAYRGWL